MKNNSEITLMAEINLSTPTLEEKRAEGEAEERCGAHLPGL